MEKNDELIRKIWAVEYNGGIEAAAKILAEHSAQEVKPLQERIDELEGALIECQQQLAVMRGHATNDKIKWSLGQSIDKATKALKPQQ